MRRTLAHLSPIVGLLSVCLSAAGVAACSGPAIDEQGVGPSPNITVTAEPPPAISGGTLIIARDGHTAVAADPDRDRVWIVDLDGGEPSAVLLQHGDQPGRVAEDASGRVHVALRGGGAVATIDAAGRKLVDRREVCRAPRGVAYDTAIDAVHVACAGGELVTLPASGGAPLRKLKLERDLRDIVVEGDRLLVSRFKAAETLVVGPDGTVLSRRTLPGFQSPEGSSYQPSVAWRLTALPGGGALMVHQRALTSPVVLAPGGYYSTAGCTGNIVHGAVSVVDPAHGAEPTGPAPAVAAIPQVTLPVDVAVAPDGEHIALVAAGNDVVVQGTVSTLRNEAGTGSCEPGLTSQSVPGQPIAVAFDARGNAVVQTREPAGIQIIGEPMIPLPGESVRDTGHEMFHRPPSATGSIACASCHPEGHEDGHTWLFDQVGLRRTQEVGGGVLKTAPLHWSGDLQDLAHLMDEVFVKRMSGPPPGLRRLNLVGRFLESLPAFPASPPEDTAAVARGEALFHSETVGCASCHSGPMFTNNQNKDVGTGAALQVPSLIGISGRAPYMHTGCAATLRDRFNPACGGDKHGNVASLKPEQIDDLIAYLESL